MKFSLILLHLIVMSNCVGAQAPANDNPCNAAPLTVGTSCSFTPYTTINATGTAGVTAPGCANYQGGDVWFSAVVPASGAISFDTNTGDITDGGMAIYSGTCNALTLINCNDDGSANGLMPSITETGLTPGSTVFIRFWGYGAANTGTFSICAQSGPTCSGSSSNSTCATATPFCTGVSYDYCNTTGVASIGGSGIYDCLLSAPNPAFFFMNIATSGPISFNISQQTFAGVGIDVDFVLWGPFASQAAVCGGISAGNAIDCSYSTAAIETANIPNASAGQWYMILITNFSDQDGVINFSQTNSSAPGAGVTNCNIVTATPGACLGGLYTLTGAITVPAPPVSGTLTITNSCNGSQVLNAPFTSPINYTIPNICGNGNTCNVSAVFSAVGAPVILPTSYTAPSCNMLTATAGACAGSGYTLSGSLTTGCLPTSGTLTIGNSCGGSVVFNAPFSSPLAWSFPSPNGNGGNCTVTAIYSAPGAPAITPFIFTEPSCCGSNAGTVGVTQTNGTQTTLANGVKQVVLCPGGTVKLNSSNNFVLPTAGCVGCTPGLMYAIYSGTGPTVPDPDLDPNWTGYFWTGENFNTANSGGLNANSAGSCSPLLALPPIAGYASPNSPANTLLFVPITADATNLPNHDANSDGCFDIGDPISITFLNAVSFSPTPACNGSVSVNITGGYPQFFPTSYALTNTGSGVLTSTSIPSGGSAVISGLTPGQTYSFSVNDGNGCTTTFSGIYSGAPTVSITPATFTVCASGCVNLAANVASGVGPGSLTFTSNQCSAIPDGGIGTANGSPTAAGNWAHTSINVSGVCATTWNTGDPLTVCLNLTHSYDSDLDIYLQAPNGVYYLLSDDNGAAGANYAGTCFSATGAAIITAGTAPFSAGPYKPEGGANNFAGLDGTPINGSWSLWVADDAVGDLGTLNNWSITFTNKNNYTYSWSPAAGLSATNILNPIACPAVTTTYTLTVTNSCGCAAAASTTLNVNADVTPLFNAIAAFCSGSAAPLLPTTSTNGITGSWTPGVVDNINSATYTFTPTAGQCGLPTTLDITVTPNIIPIFNAIAAFCSGSAAPLLPTTSTNGITGSWTPGVVDNINSATYTFTPTAGQCALPTILGITVTPNVTPIFNAIAAFCSGSPAPLLPTTSTNGITGSWTPGVVDNINSATYTFTPTAGQCALPTTLGITVTPNVTPIFNAIAAFCSGSAASLLPTTSTNGITGSWTPGVVDNINSATYTFTPTAGQCALPTTLGITVTPNVIPIFNAIAAFCSGSAAPLLPTTSTNGITGSWTPGMISNTSSGTYNFTPDPAQCGLPTTLDISIIQLQTSLTNITICNNLLPYSWNSNTFSTGGTYDVTLQSAAGCDSIVTLNLTVNQLLTSTTNVTICNNQLPYQWNNSTYPTAGTYDVNFTSTAGCDSIVTLNLTVNPVLTSTTNVTICNNQLPYIWNSNSYPAAGTYLVTLISSAGCDSMATLQLTVNDVLTSTTDITICNNQLPYIWNSNSYPASGNYSVTLVSSAGCDSIASLHLTVNDVLTSTTDITICNNQLPYSWNSNSYPASGSYSVTLVSSGGCDSIASLHLTVNDVLTSTTDITICNNQLPYSWNSNVYAAAGTYLVTLISSAGCDSMATLHFTVNDVVTSLTDITICNNQLPYSWNSNSYPAAGTYSVTLGSSGGCDSIASLHLTVNDVLTSTTDITICNNQLPYIWNSNSYPASGSYSVTLISSAGCDSIASLHLTVNDVLTSTTDITICNNQLPYIWNSNSYPASGIYSVTLISSAGCDSIASLHLSVNSVLTSLTDITICNNQLPYSWNSNSYPAAGTYLVTLISSAGCDSMATLHLTVNDVLTSLTDITICNNQLPYNWNNNSYPAAGTYLVTLVSSAGCDSTATLHLTVNDVVTSITDITICNNQLPYNWNNNSYPAAGTYLVTLISSAGCDSMATLHLTVNDVLTSLTDITICNNQLPYSWNSNSYPAAGTYSVTLGSSGGCDSIASLHLTVNDVLTSTTDITICNNQLPYIWNSNSYPASGSYSVTLISSAGCDSIASLHLTVNDVLTSTTDITICNNQLPYIWNSNSYPASGIYSVTLISSAGCDSIASLHLSVNSVLTSLTDITICNNQLPYSWNSNSYPAAGTYLVTLISSAGCDSMATLHLTVNDVLTSLTDITICNNQLPYNWNNNSYPAAGTYLVTLVSSAGCDSTATLHLTVNDVVTSITDITICNNQLPYNWNNNSYPAAGTYLVTLISSAGCDSMATLHLTVNDVLTSLTDITICNNQLPYNWNNNSYPAAGTYLVTLVSSAGCDSTATLHLTVNDVVTSITDITICNNQLPYNWNSNAYPASGTYLVTLISSTGCDSVATLHLTVNDVLTSTTDITICDNQLPYSWNSNSYPASGSYSVTLVSSAGCDSIASLQLSVNSRSISSTSVSICSDQLPYSWNGQDFSTSGAHPVSLVNSNGCDSIATLNLLVLTTSTSNSSATICSNQYPYTWNGENYTTPGLHTVILLNQMGCDSLATLNLIVRNTTTSITNIVTCSNQLPYYWNGLAYTTAGLHAITLLNVAGCDSVATLNLVINPVLSSLTQAGTCTNQLPYIWNGQQYNTAGSFPVTLTSSAGCDSVAILHLLVHPVVASTTNASVCSAMLPYNWNGQSYTSSGAHMVTLTSSAGCDSLATLQLTVNLTPLAPTVSGPVVYCQFESTDALNAGITTPGSQLVWYSSSSAGGSAIAPLPSSAVAGTTTYYVSQQLGSCEGPRVTITVTVNGKPSPGPDQSLKICFGQHANLAGLYNTTGNTASWTLNTQPIADPTSVATAGNYQMVVTSPAGCSDTVLTSLTINPQVVANAGIDGDAETNAPYQLMGSGGVAYQWSPAAPLNNPFIVNPTAVISHDETFILMVMDDIGCFDLDTVTLRALNGPSFYIPTAFTPNGDGLNDTFGPTAIGILKLDFFRVFNRYGELVFESHDLLKGWDGNYKGKKQNIDNYVWHVKGLDRFGKERILRGNVLLIR